MQSLRKLQVQKYQDFEGRPPGKSTDGPASKGKIAAENKLFTEEVRTYCSPLDSCKALRAAVPLLPSRSCSNRFRDRLRQVSRQRWLGHMRKNRIHTEGHVVCQILCPILQFSSLIFPRAVLKVGQTVPVLWQFLVLVRLPLATTMAALA